jgi:hypothetical protein
MECSTCKNKKNISDSQQIAKNYYFKKNVLLNIYLPRMKCDSWKKKKMTQACFMIVKAWKSITLCTLSYCS